MIYSTLKQISAHTHHGQPGGSFRLQRPHHHQKGTPKIRHLLVKHGPRTQKTKAPAATSKNNASNNTCHTYSAVSASSPEMIDLYEKNAARATTGNTCWIDLFISGAVIGEAKSPGKREAYRVKVKITADTDRFRRVSCSARGPTVCFCELSPG